MIRRGRVEVSGGFLLVAALLFYLDTENLLPWAALSCALHEVGHYAAVRLLGGDILRFRLTAVGGEMTLDRRRTLSYGRELISILAGPGVNLAAACFAARWGGGEVGWLLTGLNLSLGLFNLMPVCPLDGGRALSLALMAFGPPGVAEEVMRLCSLLFVAGLLLVGGALFLESGRNFTLMSVALWLLVGLLRKSPRKQGVLRKNVLAIGQRL